MADPVKPPTIAPGVVPLGYSYVIGQMRLHSEDQPGGDYQAAYRDPALLASQFNADVPGYSSFAATSAQLAGQGPIPPDVLVTDASVIQKRIDDGFWDKKDRITKEHHVYWFGFRERRDWIYEGAFVDSTNAKDLELLAQFSGFSETQNKWILPNQQGIPIVWYHLKEGSRLSDGQWEHYVNFGETSDNAAFQNAWMEMTFAAISIVASMFGQGGTVGQIGQMIIQSLPTLITAIATGNSDGVLASLEGITMGLIADVLKDPVAGAAIKDQISKMGALGGDLVTFVDSTGKTVSNVLGSAEAEVSSVVSSSQGYVNTLLSQAEQGIPGSWKDVEAQIVGTRTLTADDIVSLSTLSTLQALGKPLTPDQFSAIFGTIGQNLQDQFDGLVGQTAIDRSRAVFGVSSDVPIGQAGSLFVKYGTSGQYVAATNPACYFFDLAIACKDSSDLVTVANTVPWYAVEYFTMGATIRAAQLAQQDAPRFRKYYGTTQPRPGGGLPGASWLSRVQQATLASTIVAPSWLGK